MVTDKIADFIIRIKNANRAGKASVSVSASKLSAAIAEALVRAGFVESCAKSASGKTLEITLRYGADKEPKVAGVARVSKPSRRVYLSAADIKPFRNGFGATVFSTPAGILSDKEASAKRVGGEALFRIW